MIFKNLQFQLMSTQKNHIYHQINSLSSPPSGNCYTLIYRLTPLLFNKHLSFLNFTILLLIAFAQLIIFHFIIIYNREFNKNFNQLIGFYVNFLFTLINLFN